MAISVVHTTAANTLTVTIPATTAGNCLIVCVDSFAASAQSISGVTLGGAAGNFASLKNVGGGASQALSAIWADPNCAGGQTSVVVSGTNLDVSSASGGIVVFEAAGLASTIGALLDQSSSGISSGTAWSSGNAVATAAAELWVGTADVGTVATQPASPWANTVCTGSQALAGVQVTTSAGTATYAGTAASSAWTAVVVTLFGAPAASGTLQPAATRPAPRRRPARAWIRFTPGTTTNAAPAPPVSGTLQPLPTLPAPRRRPSRAWVRFTPGTTTNAAARTPGTIQPRPTVPIPRRRPSRAWVRFIPGTTTNAAPVPRQLLISLASQAGTDDYGNTFPQGIKATAGVIEGPTLVGSDAFFYSPAAGFGNLTESITSADGTDAYGNAWIAGTATYADNGTFWSAVVVASGVITWYKAAGPGGPWVIEAGIGFTFNGITGGGLSITAPAGLSGSFAIPQPAPAATSAAIISALFAAGIFK